MTAEDTAGWALLDIGGDVGALLVVTGPEWTGTEIEVEHLRTGRQEHAVARRGTGDARALFPALAAGDYTFSNPRLPRDRISIRGGKVSFLRLPTSTRDEVGARTRPAT